MNVFLSCSFDDIKADGSYLKALATLVRGNHSVKFKSTDPTMYAEFINWCKGYNADAVIITNQATLELVLHAQADFRPPNTKKGITLNDYQGSVLNIRISDTKSIPAVVLNPLEHLRTVPYGKYLAERFLSKILTPEKWMPDIQFQWKLADVGNANAIVERLATARLLAVDIETPTEGPKQEARFINCVGYAGLFLHDNVPTIECYVFPFEDWSYDSIRRVNDNQVKKVFQNGLYDNVYFMRWGLPVRNWYWDTYHFFHSWLAELPKDLGLITAFSVRNVRYWKDDGKSGNLEDYYRYNAKDCWATLCAILNLLHDAPDWAVTNYVEHEFPVVFPAITCELEGFKIDEDRFREVFKEKMLEKHKELIEIQQMVGGPCDTLPIAKKSDGTDKIINFNPNSPKQVLQLYKLLGCGHLGSTDKAATLKARAAHPLNDRVIGAVADWKSNARIISNYLQEYKLWTGRLFYKLDPAGTDTGRLASKASSFWCGFQIQNIPRDDSVKQCLIADNGWLLGEGDYAQSEARCVGYMSGETKLIELVESPNDYHAWNAAEFFGTPYEQIYRNATPDSDGKTLNKPLRDLSKRTNHGANYNMGPGVMLDTMGPKYVAEAKRLLKLPPKLALKEVCRLLLEKYDRTYPRVRKDWYASIVKSITISGMLVSPLGWTRRFFGKPHENKQHLNAAVAHGPQNLSVGIINKCFYSIWRRQIYGDLRGKFRIKAQIHDSILFQYRSSCPEVPGLVREGMRQAITVTDTFGITRTMVIPPDMNSGTKRWSEMKG
jgi:hypothetical protein